MIKNTAAVLHRAWRRYLVFVERGVPTASLAKEPVECSHCGHVFSGNYCPRCGQHRDAGKGKPRFLKTFREAYPQLSNNFIRTIVHLALRPGYMIRDYFRGHRVPYQNPVSTFLIAVSIAALCSGIFNRVAHSDQPKDQPTALGLLSKVVDDELDRKAGENEKVRVARDRWNDRRSLDGHRRIAAALTVVKEKLASDVTFTLFALFPLLGTMSYVVFRKRKFDGRRLTLMEHYLIFAYLYAFFSFVDWIQFLPVFYVGWTYRGLFRLSWARAMGYAVLVFLLTTVLLLLLFLLFIATMVAPVVYYFVVQ